MTHLTPMRSQDVFSRFHKLEAQIVNEGKEPSPSHHVVTKDCFSLPMDGFKSAMMYAGSRVYDERRLDDAIRVLSCRRDATVDELFVQRHESSLFRGSRDVLYHFVKVGTGSLAADVAMSRYDASSGQLIKSSTGPKAVKEARMLVEECGLWMLATPR